MKKNLLSAVVGIMFMGLFSQAWAAHFSGPTWNGYALDWCVNFEQGCGKPAADLWCKKKGYNQSSSFVKRNAMTVPTMTIGQNAICNPSVHRCDSFVSIDCLESAHVFHLPKTNGYRLDWCRHFENECGAPAAQTFCQKNGYPHLVSFQKQSHLNIPTMTIVSNAICNPKFHTCDSFTFVSCKK